MSTSKMAHRLAFDLGLLDLLRVTVRRRGALILLFHRFRGTSDGHPRGLPIDRFADFMSYLTHRYRVVPLEQLREELSRGAVRPSTAVVTIDDGYHEVFTSVAPVLRQYGVPASIFVVSDFIDGRLWLWPDRLAVVFDRAPATRITFLHGGDRHTLDLRQARDRRQAREQWLERAKTLGADERERLLDALAESCGVVVPPEPPPEYRPMSWVELRALAGEGFDVGAHTSTHPILSRVSLRDLSAEINGCKATLERHLGRTVQHFAYPNGRRADYTAAVASAVACAGYRAAVTTVSGGNTPATPLFELLRVPARVEDVTRFARAAAGLDELWARYTAGPAGT